MALLFQHHFAGHLLSCDHKMAGMEILQVSRPENEADRLDSMPAFGDFIRPDDLVYDCLDPAGNTVLGQRNKCGHES
jgi:hypothetical protein